MRSLDHFHMDQVQSLDKALCDVREMREDNEKTWKGGTIEKSGFVFLPDYISLWVVFEQ